MNDAIFILLLLLCVGCAAPRSEIGDRRWETATMQNKSVILPEPFHRGVTWNYELPMPADNIAFDLESTTNLVDWRLIATTNQPPALWDSFDWTEYVRVGAHWINP